jgi:hypothetical protein
LESNSKKLEIRINKRGQLEGGAQQVSLAYQQEKRMWKLDHKCMDISMLTLITATIYHPLLCFFGVLSLSLSLSGEENQRKLLTFGRL